MCPVILMGWSTTAGTGDNGSLNTTAGLADAGGFADTGGFTHAGGFGGTDGSATTGGSSDSGITEQLGLWSVISFDDTFDQAAPTVFMEGQAFTIFAPDSSRAFSFELLLASDKRIVL